MAEAAPERMGQSFNFFLSLEMKRHGDFTKFEEDVKKLQAEVARRFPERAGKPTRIKSLHVTLLTLKLEEEEFDQVVDMVQSAVNSYRKIHAGLEGLCVNFKGVGYARNEARREDTIFAEMMLGNISVRILRDFLLDGGLHRFVTDEQRWPHLTFYRKSRLSDSEKEEFRKAMEDIEIGRVEMVAVTLRKRKHGTTVLPPCKEFALWQD